MTWARIGDDFNERPALDDLSLSARMLYVEALVYCNRFLTDGSIKGSALVRFSRLDDPATAAAELVDAGIWSTVGIGWSVVGYLDRSNPDRQLSRERVEDDRSKASERFDAYQERGKRHAQGDHSTCTKSCPAKRNGVANDAATTQATPFPSPSPVPSIEKGKGEGGDGVGRSASSPSAEAAGSGAAVRHGVQPEPRREWTVNVIDDDTDDTDELEAGEDDA
jgi:hypothetical protein